jgi:aspartate-semialdehyde dehydrogenase
MRLALAGATGMVGSVMLQVLEERNIRPDELIAVGTERSKGKTVNFNGQPVKVVTMEEALKKKPDFALFSAGSDASREWAPKFAKNNCRVIDNSSCWRLHENIPLVVPEINSHAIKDSHYIIANPNCSTIQLVMAVYPLHKAFGLIRMVVSTYQSVTGSGVAAVRQLDSERKGETAERAYPHPIDLNCLPHCDDFLENGYTKEEMKLVHESRKIMHHPEPKVTSTAVRVPVKGGHSESVNLTFSGKVETSKVREILEGVSGITVVDDPAQKVYPMPLNAEGKDDVFVGRIRKDESWENSINMWIVADNLRKGAATNAVQILEKLI